MNAYMAVREREKIKAAVFITLTALLATVAGLITHFDALGHAAGLPVTDKGVSGFIPLWVMTALRAIAVIGFLLASRLKNISFNELHRKPALGPLQGQKLQSEPAALEIDYNALATALIEAMRQAGAIGRISITEEEKLGALSAQEDNHRQHPKLMLLHGTDERWEPTNNRNQRRNRNLQVGTRTNHQQEPEPLKGNQLTEKREPGQSQKPEPVPDENPSMGTGTHPQWEPTSEDQ